MAAFAKPGVCSHHQRGYIVGLMHRLELDHRRFTLMHRRVFAAAGLGEPPVDRPVDPFLATLTPAQAGHLIDALEADLPEGEEDDDED